MSYPTVIRESEHPYRRALRNWYEEYLQDGNIHQGYVKKTKFSEDEKEIAVNYYLENGKSVSTAVKKLGYPRRPVLDKWILERAPDEKRHCRAGGSNIKYTREQKEKAVISLCSGNEPAKQVAEEHRVTIESIYNWKRQLLKEELAKATADNAQEH
jgi:transposase-like protein